MLAVDNKNLFETLQELQVIGEYELGEAYQESLSSHRSLGGILLEKDLIQDENLGEVEADLLNIPFVHLSQISIPNEILRIIPEVVARKQRAIAFARDANGLKIAMSEPVNTEFGSLVAKKTGDKIALYLATERDIRQAFSLYRKDLQKTFDELLAEQVNKASATGDRDAPISAIVALLIEYAYSNHASDVHIEPEKKASQVRFRIDGVLHDVLSLPKILHEQVVSKIKVAAKLRTDEKMSAQDGKMQAAVENQDLDIRVSIVPVIKGEKVVLRILSASSNQISLTDLGMAANDLAKVKNGFQKPFGMVLATGPTGCGKTTTIYSVLKILNTRDVNIATIEDPVEYDIENINQIQVNSKTNLTFANGLRAILRQDPNIIFVGEIRDQETADIAVRSAMTGHLVLSTLHTNDATTTLPRLIGMGIEPFLVASTVNVIIGQRLVRKICQKCRVSEDAKLEDLKKNLPSELVKKYIGDKSVVRIYKGKGCPICHNTGYQGRVGIFEVLVVSDKIKSLISSQADNLRIKRQAVAEGMNTMLEDGLVKVQEGITTIDEVLKATKQ